MLRLLVLVLTCLSFHVSAQEASTGQSMEALKQSIVQLNQQLTTFEHELMYPNTEVALFLSVSPGTPVRLVDVNLSVDGEHVGYHFYTDEEFEALRQGGIQRLYTNNLATGKHTVEAVITGYDADGKDYQKVANYELTKSSGRQYIELRVVDNVETSSHRFEFAEWNQP